MARVDYRNIERETLRNTDYRRVLHTVKGEMQLVIMCLNPGEDIPCERHAEGVQFIRVERGAGECIVGRASYALTDGMSIIIPPRKLHYVRNISETEPLKLYTIYTPPEHATNKKQRRQKRRGGGGSLIRTI